MLRQIIDSYAATLNREWNYDRSKTVGASEIGQCARKTYWMKVEGTSKGVRRDPDWEDKYGARIRGTVMEASFWQPAMKARFGSDLLVSGNEQYTLRKGYLSATPDALIVNQPRDALKDIGVVDIGSDCFMAECKTIDPRTNLIEAKSENLFQVHVQLGLTRDCTEYRPVFDLLSYMDASFWSEIIEYPVEFDPEIYKAAEDRATVIMTTDHARDLPPEGWIAGGKECSFCPYVGPCGVERRSVPQNNAKATPQFIAEITDYCVEANRLETAKEADEIRLRTIQQTIKDRLREKGVRRIQGVVNWYEVAGSTHYGSKAMRERLAELGEDADEFASIGNPSDRLVIAAIPAALPVKRLLPGKLAKRKMKNVKGKGKSSGRKSGAAGKRGPSRGKSRAGRATAAKKSGRQPKR